MSGHSWSEFLTLRQPAAVLPGVHPQLLEFWGPEFHCLTMQVLVVDKNWGKRSFGLLRVFKLTEQSWASRTQFLCSFYIQSLQRDKPAFLWPKAVVKAALLYLRQREAGGHKDTFFTPTLQQLHHYLVLPHGPTTFSPSSQCKNGPLNSNLFPHLFHLPVPPTTFPVCLLAPCLPPVSTAPVMGTQHCL